MNYFSSEGAARETFDKVREMSGKALLEKADVSSRAEVDAMVKRVLLRFGRIDILVNSISARTTHSLLSILSPSHFGLSNRL